MKPPGFKTMVQECLRQEQPDYLVAFAFPLNMINHNRECWLKSSSYEFVLLRSSPTCGHINIISPITTNTETPFYHQPAVSKIQSNMSMNNDWFTTIHSKPLLMGIVETAKLSTLTMPCAIGMIVVRGALEMLLACQLFVVDIGLSGFFMACA